MEEELRNSEFQLAFEMLDQCPTFGSGNQRRPIFFGHRASGLGTLKVLLHQSQLTRTAAKVGPHPKVQVHKLRTRPQNLPPPSSATSQHLQIAEEDIVSRYV